MRSISKKDVMRSKVFFFYLCILCSCSKSKDNTVPLNSNHIEYFGFTLVDTYWDDPTDSEAKTNYSEEVAPFSNVADILVVQPTDNIVARMQSMEQLQMKSILHVAELLFEVDGSDSPSGTNYSLRADYQSRWDDFVNVNNLNVNQNLVQAFYIGEEPTWNGISSDSLELASDYVKSSFPQVPIMVIEAYPTIKDLNLPSTVDWVGFDHYFIKDPKNNTDFMNELQLLKSKMNVNQKLVLIMDAHYIDFAHGDFGGIALNEMGIVADNYYELAIMEPATIAVLGYFWPSGFDQENSIGARNMPAGVREEYVQIGKRITGK